MKFSVLLPTRNRLEYLKFAVESVRRQEYEDWEIIISDNFSEDDIAGYVGSLDDARIKYSRADSFVSVTENWNNALRQSSGDYVVMLGDDDCLMKHYFTKLRELIEEFTEPDLIYTGTFLFMYPGVGSEYPDGFLQPHSYATFQRSARAPYLLDKRRARKVVDQFLDFRLRYGYNMQFALVRREFIESLREKGEFYQSPFPDYYAMNALFLTAERILVCPSPLVTIGVTPRSYGFFHVNRRESEGIEFLAGSSERVGDSTLADIILPGTNINTSWLGAAEALKENYGAQFEIQVNYARYRMLQIEYVYREHYVYGRYSGEEMSRFRTLLSRRERALGSLFRLIGLTLRPIPEKVRTIVAKGLELPLLGQFPIYPVGKQVGRYKNLLEVFEQVDPLA